MPSRAPEGSSTAPARSSGQTGRSQPATASRTTFTGRCSTSSLPPARRRETHARIGARLEDAYARAPEGDRGRDRRALRAGGRCRTRRRLAASRGRAGVRAARPSRGARARHPGLEHARAPPRRSRPLVPGARTSVDARSSADRDAGLVVAPKPRPRSCGPTRSRGSSTTTTTSAGRSSGSARSTRCAASTSAPRRSSKRPSGSPSPSAGTGLLTDAHEQLACSLFHQGAFDRALEHAEQGPRRLRRAVLQSRDGGLRRQRRSGVPQLGGPLAVVPRLPRPRARSRTRGGGVADDPRRRARIRHGARAGRNRRAMPPRHRGNPRERRRRRWTWPPGTATATASPWQ